MRRIRPTKRRLEQLMRKRGVGAGVVVTAVTAGVIFTWLFRAGPQPEGVGAPPPQGPLVIDLLTSWTMHTILAGVGGSGNPDGSDGVYAADMDGDGLLDIVSGHEQGLRVSVSFHPGLASVTSPWPSVMLPTVQIGSVEDAIACDVDQDGAMDVVSASETGTFRVEVMFAPSPPNTRADLLVASNWTRVTLDASSANRSMRAQCADIAGDAAPELIIGGKDANGVASSLGYYSSATPRTGSSWNYTSIIPVGWVMQMYVLDFDGDGNLDIVYSDRTQILTPSADGTKRGVRWLESDGADPPAYTEHQIVGPEADHKWFDLVDWDGDGDLDVVDCHSNGDGSVNEGAILINGGGGLSWTEVAVPQPTGVGQCQMASAADLDKDGQIDVLFSYFNATNLESVVWLKKTGAALTPTLERGTIAGILDVDSDTKMDNIVLFDVDGDLDLDVVVSEQHVPAGTGPGLGVIWFENPLAPADPGAGDDGGDDAPPDDGSDDAPPDDGGGSPVSCSLLTSGSSTTDATSIATAAVTPGANRPVFAAIVTTSSVANQRAPSTVTGAGLSLTQLADQAFTTVSTYRRLTVWEGVAASPTTEAVTFDFGAGGNLASWGWAIVECAGGDPADPSLQTDIATVAAGTTAPTALAALDSANSAHVCIVGQSVNSATAVTPDAQFAELAESAFANGSGSIEVAWANDETGCDASWGSADAAQLSIEVAP
jgi:hypothetical protein